MDDNLVRQAVAILCGESNPPNAQEIIREYVRQLLESLKEDI
jgi:hypothetical protein